MAIFCETDKIRNYRPRTKLSGNWKQWKPGKELNSLNIYFNMIYLDPTPSPELTDDIS